MAYSYNQPMDFASQQAAIEEQKKMAEILRKKAATPTMGEGQMVGNTFVKPHWMEGVADLFKNYQAGQADQELGTKQKGLAEAAAQARQQWQQQAPQAMPAQEEQQGPVDPNNPQELAAKPALPLTTGQISAHTLKGMEIPGNEKAAGVYQSAALADLTREDTQAAKKEALTATLGAAREKRLDDLKLAQERLAEQRQYHEGMLKQGGLDNSTRLQIAGMVAQSKRDSDAAALERARLMKSVGQSKEDKETDNDTEHLSKRAEPLIQVVSPANQIQGILDNAYDPKTKKYAKIKGFGLGARLTPLGLMDNETATNYGAQQSLGNALLKAGAGLSQTLSEKENQMIEQMRQGTADQDQFTAVWPGILNKLNAQIGVTRAGYNPKVQETFDKRFADAGSSITFKPIKSKHERSTDVKPVTVKPANMSQAAWDELLQLRAEEAAKGGQK